MAIDQLLFYVAGHASEEDAAAVRRFVESISIRRKWTVGPPLFVDTLDDSSCTRPEDEPVRTLGGVLTLLPRQASAEKELDLLQDVETVVRGLEELSRIHDLEFELQLGDTYIGDIRAGKSSRLINEGLLAEWRKGLVST